MSTIEARTVTPRIRPRMRDVAALAGVSVQTVSRVINGHPDVAEETRGRIQTVIQTVGFHPNAIARSLITDSSNMLGVVAGGFQHYGPSQLLTGIEREAAGSGWQVLLQVADVSKPDDYERIANNLIAQRVAGIVWAYPELTGGRERAFHAKVQSVAPIIFLSMEAQSDSAVISVDNRMGARLVVDHLIARGRRNIGIITGPMALWSAQQRQQGWMDALQSAGRWTPDAPTSGGNWSAASGALALHDLKARHPNLDAVFASNDQMALGALRAAHELGIRVPADLAVAGFDDTPESPFFSPPLTTIHHNLETLGQLAVRELHRVVDLARASSELPEPAPLLLQPTLVVRQST